MNDFPTYVCDNIPGVKKFEFVPVDEVASVSEPDGMEVEVTLEVGSVWLEGYSIERLSYSEEAQETDEGVSYAVKVGGFVPGDDAELMDYFTEARTKRYLVKVTDQNDEERLVGSADVGARFSFARKKDNENNGYSFVFSAIHVDLPPFFVV